MPNALITKMQEIVDYNKDSGILTESSQAGERVRFFSKNGPKLAKISELGEGGNQFIYDATRNYANGILRPPFTLENVTKIYEQFAKIDKDLTGDPNGTDEQKAKHQEWNAFWVKQQQAFPQLTATLATVQQEILAAYRFKVLSVSVFKPKVNSTQQDEARAQDFLQEVNKRARSNLTPQAAFTDLTDKFSKRLTQDLDIMVGRLATAINNNQWDVFSQTFTQLQADKSFTYLGASAQNQLFTALAKNPTIVAKLPHILVNNDAFKTFIDQFPDHGKRQQLITDALVKAKSGEHYPHRNPLFDKLVGKDVTHTQNQHIQLLEAALKQQPANVPLQPAPLPVQQLNNLLNANHAEIADPIADIPVTRPRSNQLVLNQFQQNRKPEITPDMQIIPHKPVDQSHQAPKHK